jgi:two-component system chemotaxis sensor kinase CheA
MDLSQFYNQFREETSENVRVLNDGLLSLENADQSDPEARAQIDAIFRAVHTIKGSARVLGFGEIGRLAHTMEDQLGAVRAGQRTLDKQLIDRLLASGDALITLTTHMVEGGDAGVNIDELVAQFTADAAPDAAPEHPPVPAATSEEPAAPQAAAPVPAGVEQVAEPASAEPALAAEERPASNFRTRSVNRQTVRVRTDRLDRLINLTGELVIGQQALNLHGQHLRELAELNQQQQRVLLAIHGDIRQHAAAPTHNGMEQHVNTLLNTCAQMNYLLRSQIEQFTQYASQYHMLVDDMEQEVITTRLLPLSTIFGTLPRAVREIANATDKQVELEIHGETTELDRKLLEALSDPLLHIVRNAIDHGLEPPDERRVAGKPPQGRIQVRAEAAGGEVRISVSDDGRGIDPQRMREAATHKGLLGADKVGLLSDQEAIELIFMPGFTTAPILTDLSGRGVGMDVVRTNIGELSGQVVLESQLGQGTTIAMLLPLTLVTTRIVLVRLGSQTFALPASGCRGIVWVHEHETQTIEGRAMITHEERTVPLLRLADLLGIEAEPAFRSNERMPALLVGSERRILSVLVDQVLDEREAVVKPLGPLFESQRRYSGAIQLGDGYLVLLLNPIVLVQEARGVALARGDGAATRTRAASRLLIADDSFTTRELVRSILSSAGYDVTAAVDGADALDKLRAQPYDLVVSDVEMPRMNGFELTASIRQELGLHDLPVIIVTSLSSDEHKRRGMEAGAQAYIVKSQFNQDNLLEAIQQLLHI